MKRKKCPVRAVVFWDKDPNAEGWAVIDKKSGTSWWIETLRGTRMKNTRASVATLRLMAARTLRRRATRIVAIDCINVKK